MFRWLHLLAAMAAASPGVAHAQRTDPTPPPFVGIIWIYIEETPELIRRVTPDRSSQHWLMPSDFDAQAFAGPDIYLRIRLRVGADDRVLACGPRSRGDSSPYLTRACDLLVQRSRFIHALSTDGRPVEGDADLTLELSHRVPPPPFVGPPPPGIALPGGVWHYARPLNGLVLAGMPKDLPNRHPVAELDISIKGIVTRCVVLTSTGTDAGDIALCTLLRAAPFAPAQGAKGEPMPERDHVIAPTLSQ